MKYLLDGQETNRILFRNIDLSYFDQWLPFHEDPSTSIHWISEKESAKVECEKWYKKQRFRYKNNLGGMNALVEKETGKFIGHCGLLLQTVDGIEELEIAYSLLSEFMGLGLATEAAMKCRDYAFEKGFRDSLISIISLTNIPSERVAIKNGMKVDKVTVYNKNDVSIYRIDRSNWLKGIPQSEI